MRLCPLGLGHEGIYRKNGAKSRIKLLMEEFRKDARNVKLRIGDNFIEDVTDVLKRFFREIDDPIFMAELHPLWKEAASELNHDHAHLSIRDFQVLHGRLHQNEMCFDFSAICRPGRNLPEDLSFGQVQGDHP